MMEGTHVLALARGDEQAWLVWQRLEPYANVHAWLPPGTHSGRPVAWIDDWFEDHPATWCSGPTAISGACSATWIVTSAARAGKPEFLALRGPISPTTEPGLPAQGRWHDGVHLPCRPLDESTWPAFAALVECNNGIFGGCWCMGFHPEGVGKDTTAELNRERKLARVRTGAAHAALVFDGEDCLGGASSVRPRRCRGSRAARPTRRAGRPCRTGGSPAAASARGTGVRARPPRRWPGRWT